MTRNKKYILAAAGILLTAILIFLFFPGNDYLRKALLNGYPGIEDYRIFENRAVHAGNPVPWEFSEKYGHIRLTDSCRNEVEQYGTVAYLIIQDGKIVFEEYWDGYDEHSYSNSFSMAKSVVSMLVGCALADGYIRSTDQKVGEFLPTLTNISDLTIHQLLTMSAALDWNESEQGPFSPITRAYYGTDLDNIVGQLIINGTPGETFNYQSIVTQILAEIVKKASGKNISEYASEKIWTPIEAEQDALWSLDHKDGSEKAYCCYNSNARDFARLGQLVLNQGNWKGMQVVPADYLFKALQADTALHSAYNDGANRCYGYQFWTLNYNEMQIPYLRGILGQYVFIIPQHNAIVVRLGKQRAKEYTGDQHYPKDINIWLGCAIKLLNQTGQQ